MLEIAVAEASEKFGELLDRAEHGEAVIITREGHEVARLVPSRQPPGRAEAHAALERMSARAQALKLGKFDWDEWKQYRDEGRT